jgi:type I restriction enzyme M protein
MVAYMRFKRPGDGTNAGGLLLRTCRFPRCSWRVPATADRHLLQARVKANVAFFERKSPSSQANTKEPWVYDFRTNQHFTLKTKPLTRAALDDFVEAFKPGRRHERTEREAFKRYAYDEITVRDGHNLDLWADLKDTSVADPDSLPAPAVIAEEIVDNLAAALEQFQAVADLLSGNGTEDAAVAADTEQ